MRIDDSELDYHKFVLRQLSEAQTILRAWSSHLTKKYKLTSVDQVTEDGEIVRGEVNETKLKAVQ